MARAEVDELEIQQMHERIARHWVSVRMRPDRNAIRRPLCRCAHAVRDEQHASVNMCEDSLLPPRQSRNADRFQAAWKIVSVPVGLIGFQVFEHAEVRFGDEHRRSSPLGKQTGRSFVPSRCDKDSTDIARFVERPQTYALDRVDQDAPGAGLQEIGLK